MARVDRTERLLNLVICLMAAAAPVPRSRIRSGVFGYQDASTDQAFERMFERDKDELRSMGVPVETVLDIDGDVSGYRIDRDAYRLSAGEWTLAERMALALAARTWADAADSAVGGVVTAKIDSITGIDPAVRPPASITAADAALLPFMKAVRDHQPVTFAYLRSDEDLPVDRQVSPWGLTFTEGRWYLTGHDHGRDEQRTYRLSRVAGSVSSAAVPYVAPPEDFASTRSVVRGPGEATQASVRVRAGRGAALRRAAVESRAHDGADLLTVSFDSLSELVAAVLAAGADAEVLAPENVRELVRERLELLAFQHTPGNGAGES